MRRTKLSIVTVHRSPLDHRRGRITAGGMSFPCALGRGGTAFDKREGDGATPLGTFRLLGVRYRADRVRRPRTGLPARPMRESDGWCDDPRDRSYNRPVPLPYSASHERMWRDDRLYDLVVDIAWNRGPIVKGRGSAIFLHLARPGFAPTEGCVAVEPGPMGRLLQRLGSRTRLAIGA